MRAPLASPLVPRRSRVLLTPRLNFTHPGKNHQVHKGSFSTSHSPRTITIQSLLGVQHFSTHHRLPFPPLIEPCWPEGSWIPFLQRLVRVRLSVLGGREQPLVGHEQ